MVAADKNRKGMRGCAPSVLGGGIFGLPPKRAPILASGHHHKELVLFLVAPPLHPLLVGLSLAFSLNPNSHLPYLARGSHNTNCQR